MTIIRDESASKGFQGATNSLYSKSLPVELDVFNFCRLNVFRASAIWLCVTAFGFTSKGI
jgi:hypothetical protein